MSVATVNDLDTCPPQLVTINTNLCPHYISCFISPEFYAKVEHLALDHDSKMLRQSVNFGSYMTWQATDISK